MVKSTLIFSDQGKQTRQELHSQRNDLINVSREEYTQLIKDAYQEGREDALREQKEKNNSVAKQDGREEAVRIHAKEAEQSRQRFRTITARQDIEIMRKKTLWPFSLFPDTLLIDTTKVTVVRKQLFATEFVITIPLKDLSDVNVQTYLFMGTLLIKYMPQSNSPGMNQPIDVTVPSLRRGDAIKAKNILKGALVAKAEEIDIAKLSPQEVVNVLEKFGTSEGVI